MLALSMAFAAFWGVLQLAVLGWGTRTVRVGTSVLVMGVGFYACGAVAGALELAWTRLVAAVTGGSVADAVRTAGYTVDPFLEEIVKVLPLVIAGLHLRTRRQWGLTDHLLVGAAAGAGFGLLEGLMRFGHQPAYAASLVPEPLEAVTTWLPAPVDVELLAAAGLGGPTNLHLVWSALAGLGVGVWYRTRGRARWAGPALVVLAGADHAAYNYDLAVGDGNAVAEVLAAPFVLAQPVHWLWPAVALAVAVVIDVRALRRVRALVPALRLRREAPQGGSVGSLIRYAALGAPWTGLLVLRYVGLRRSALYGFADAGLDDTVRPMVSEVGDVRARMDVADHPSAWQGVGVARLRLDRDQADLDDIELAEDDDPNAVTGTTDSGPAAVLRQFWPLVVWLVLLLPPFLYFVVGATPSLQGVQGWLERPVVFGAVFVFPAGFGLVLLAWQGVTGVHGLPGVLRQPSGLLPALVGFRVSTAAGASLVGVLGIAAWLTGTNPARPLMAAFHLVDALDSLLLVSAGALMLGAFVFLPPSLGLGVVEPQRGARELVPAVSLTPGLPSLLGVGGVMLAQAVANSGGAVSLPAAGLGSVPDIAREPAPAKPPVHHGRLRRIVDDLWAGTANDGRVGDGTTMDAVRNEVLTGRPTNGRFHLDKARHAVDRLTNWVDEYGSSASRTDRSWAWELRARLQRSLDGAPADDEGREAVVAFVERLVTKLPDLRDEYHQIYRECVEDGLTHAAPEVFVDEQTRALRYRFRDGVIEARAELEALAAAIEAEYGVDPDVDEVVDACFLALLSVAPGGGPDARTVLGPKLSAVVGERRDWRAAPAAAAFVERLTGAVPPLARLATDNRYGDRGDVLVHGFLADVAFRELENHRSGGPVAMEEVGTVLAFLEAELGRDRGVDEAIAVSFVGDLPHHPDEPGADVADRLGPKLRAELERQRVVVDG